MSDLPLSDSAELSMHDPALDLLEREWDRNVVEFQPWMKKSPEIVAEQVLIHELLKRKAGAKRIGKNVFIARDARIFTNHFEIGDNSWIAGGAIVRGRVAIGRDTSINPYAHIAGHVKIGSAVRIGGMSAIYGFNHGISRVDIPIFRQPATTEGIIIGDGTWVGTNVVIVDGCKIGAHCVIAAGAVVTRSCGDYQIIGGNPARLLRDRRSGT